MGEGVGLETMSEIYETILLLLILIGILYLAFFKSYFKEKGKLLAKLEEVDTLTKAVEEIRAQLKFSLQAKLSFRAEEHSALVDYFSKFHLWFSTILNAQFAKVSIETIEDLDRLRSEVDNLYKEMSLAVGRMELFVDNPALTAQQSQLTIETLKLQGCLDSATYKLEECFIDAEHRISASPDQRVRILKDCLAKKREIVREWQQNLVAHNEILSKLIHQHKSTISSHLKALLEP